MLLNGAANVTLTVDDIGLVNLSTGAVAHGNSSVRRRARKRRQSRHPDRATSSRETMPTASCSPAAARTATRSRVHSSAPTRPACTRCQTPGASSSPAGQATTRSAERRPSARDVISGNGWTGIELNGSGTTGNVVEGDYIGTDSTGNTALANPVRGVAISGGSSGNTVSGDVISGNSLAGVWINGSSNNVISGDTIGLSQNGTSRLARIRKASSCSAARAAIPSAGPRQPPAT